MTKLSSRLQSRLAKRRATLRQLEADRATGKALTKAGSMFVEVGLLSQAVFDQHIEAYKTVRQLTRDVAEDQQLDKQLLKLAYKAENFTFILGNDMLPLQIVFDLEANDGDTDFRL